jgi:ATP-dependent DNA helicase RecG
MPSALETLVKILKLEREQGYKNSAVTHGLSQYIEVWKGQAHAQARIPEHHALVDEIYQHLRPYEGVEARDDRHQLVQHTLDRIFRKAPPPADFAERVAYYTANMPPARPASALTADEAPRPPREDRRREEPAETVGDERPPARRERAQNRVEGDARPRTAADARPQGEGDARGRARNETPPDAAAPDAARPTRRQRAAEQAGGREGDHAPRPAKGSAPARPQGGQRPPKDGDGQRQNAPKRKGEAAAHAETRSIFEGNSHEHSDLEYEFRGTAPGRLDLPMPTRLARPPRKPRPQLGREEAHALLYGLNAEVGTIKGIGEANAALLAKLGIRTVKDLLTYMPRRYDDYTQLSPVSRIVPEQVVTLIGTITNATVQIGRGGRRDFVMTVDDGTAAIAVTFFGQHYLARTLHTGEHVLLHGKAAFFARRLQMTNPEWEPVEIEDLKNPGIVPVYGLTEGLRNKALRRLMRRALDYWADRIPDYVPVNTLDRAELADLGWTLQNLHFPQSADHLAHAQRRFIFDQLLLLQLAILGNRRAWQAEPAVPLPVEDAAMDGFFAAAFPYALTGAQKRAIGDIRADMARELPMNRLLQGDVGSGKTAVALSAMVVAFMNGVQSALMAPTSILAEQHYQNFEKTFARLPEAERPRIALLTGALPAAERAAVLDGLASGAIDMVVGTHALIQDGVQFRNLALAIIDEQHRFGVEQRRALRGKAAHTNPHLLVMTATPIPRTLALTLYADLDLSIIDEMPPGRTPPKTHVIEPVARERAYKWIEETFLQHGQQAFVVYPLVEASDRIEAESAVEAHEKLSRVFYKYRVGLLHGKMKPAEKDAVMADFRNQAFDVLVTTSVAEVGVDIPNAAVILIESANRFGLASLHQFRGRVGRGGLESACLLLCDTQDKAARDRLDVLRTISDGFRLAEADWRMRGAGDLVGTRQSGQNRLQLTEAMSPELVELAQREARTVYAEDPDLAAPHQDLLAERVAMLIDERSDLS